MVCGAESHANGGCASPQTIGAGVVRQNDVGLTVAESVWARTSTAEWHGSRSHRVAAPPAIERGIDAEARCPTRGAQSSGPTLLKEGRIGRLRCAPLIAMIGTSIGRSDGSVIWRVLLEAEVRSTPMIVPAVGCEDAPEVRRVDDDHVIETPSSD